MVTTPKVHVFFNVSLKFRAPTVDVKLVDDGLQDVWIKGLVFLLTISNYCKAFMC